MTAAMKNNIAAITVMAVMLIAARSVDAKPSTNANADPPAMFSLKLTDAPKDSQCMQVDVPPGLIRTLWEPCNDKDPRGPPVTFSMVPQPGGTVVFEEQHFTNLAPGVSRQCLGANPQTDPTYTDLVMLQDCKDGAAYQQWKYNVDSKTGVVQIISTFGKYSGQCLVQMQSPSVKQESASDYYGELGFLPCGTNEPTSGKGIEWITPPSMNWVLTPVTKLEPLQELIPDSHPENTVPKGSFKLLMPEQASDYRCMLSDNMSGFEINAGTCISVYSDTPVAIFKTVPTKQGNVQFVEQHGKDCLTYRDKELMDGDVHIAPQGTNLEECKPDQLFQQWKFDEQAGKIASADPKYIGQCLRYVPSTDGIGLYDLTNCDKATKFAKYSEYMRLDYYTDE